MLKEGGTDMTALAVFEKLIAVYHNWKAINKSGPNYPTFLWYIVHAVLETETVHDNKVLSVNDSKIWIVVII